MNPPSQLLSQNQGADTQPSLPPMDPQFGWLTLEDGWRKGPWTPQEDKLLIDHVNLHGEGRWNSVSNLTGLKRSGKSCRLRWVNYLRPDLKRGKITPHEEAIIVELHSLWGNRWSTIARSLPGRTDNEIKNYWRTHFKVAGKPSSSRKAKRPPPYGGEILVQEQKGPEVDTKGMMPQAEAAALLQEIQEMGYMYPMGCMYQGGGGSSGGAVDEGSTSEEGAWGSLWNLDDVPVDEERACSSGGVMQQDQMLYR